MKKTLLFTALLGLMGTEAQAVETTAPVATPPISQATTAPAATNTSTTKAESPEKTTVTPAPATTAATTEEPQNENANNKALNPTNAAAAPTTKEIDCKYHIGSNKTAVEESIVKTWSEKAAIQSFDFSPATLDAQLAGLKPCFTDQGWQGFNEALQQSGNVNAIKSQNLTVSSQVDGEIQINSPKDNQWKATIPMQVVYQNEKEKMTQLLSVELLIGRKVSGDLGIMQIIATPRVASAQATGTTPAEPAKNTAAVNDAAPAPSSPESKNSDAAQQ